MLIHFSNFSFIVQRFLVCQVGHAKIIIFFLCVNYKITCACIHLKYTKHHRVHMYQTSKKAYILQSTQHGFTFSTLPPWTNFILRGGQQASGRGDRPQSPLRVTVIRGGSLSYGCIYKTHFSPIMLVSISMCVFSMILKYRTLYSKSKISLNREKLLKNDVSMSTILFIMERRK